MIEDPQPKPSVSLARGGADDLDAVVAVMGSAFDPRFGEAWTRSQCAGILSMPGVRLTIARDSSDAAAGFSLSRTVADEAELLLIAVEPAHRRRGVGQMLLDHFLDHARQSGASHVHLEVREGNPAIAMYRRSGFSPAGRRRKYYLGKDGSEFDALTLIRPSSIDV
jgi:[ribosomal protein S18]-alanine N-acetyltransferase